MSDEPLSLDDLSRCPGCGRFLMRGRPAGLFTYVFVEPEPDYEYEQKSCPVCIAAGRLPEKEQPNG